MKNFKLVLMSIAGLSVSMISADQAPVDSVVNESNILNEVTALVTDVKTAFYAGIEERESLEAAEAIKRDAVKAEILSTIKEVIASSTVEVTTPVAPVAEVTAPVVTTEATEVKTEVTASAPIAVAPVAQVEEGQFVCLENGQTVQVMEVVQVIEAPSIDTIIPTKKGNSWYFNTLEILDLNSDYAKIEAVKLELNAEELAKATNNGYMDRDKQNKALLKKYNEKHPVILTFNQKLTGSALFVAILGGYLVYNYACSPKVEAAQEEIDKN